MPSSLDPGDRKLLHIGGAILLALIVVSVVLAPSDTQDEGPGIPTTYSTARNGAQAAYLLLRELGYHSERWEKPPTELPAGADAQGTILILARPANFPDKAQREALLAFARSGGWIVYAGDFPFLFLDAGEVVQPTPLRLTDPEQEKFQSIAPSPFARSAETITLRSAGRWRNPEGAQVPLYGDPQQPVVVTWRVGNGRILWWASPTPVTNSGITLEGNLSFFLDCVSAARPGRGPAETTVLWDEFFHGYTGSLWDYFSKTPVPWAAFQLALVAILVLFAFGRRSGPIYTPAAVSRLSPLEFVDTLGDLYRRAGAGSSAVRVAYQRFRTQLLRRLSLASTVSNMQLDAAVRERLGWKQPGFFDAMQRAEKASREGEVSGRTALELVQALEHYEVLFGLKTRPNEENR